MAGEPMSEAGGILIIAGDPAVLTATAGMVRQAGYEPLEATSGEEGIALARRESPEVVLLEATLGDEDESNVGRRLRAESGLSMAIVALVSEGESADHTLASGPVAWADDVFLRPLRPAELPARLNALLRLQRAEEAALERHHKLLDAQILAGVGDFVWEIPSGEVTWSAGARKLLGYGPGDEMDFEMVQNRVHHPEDRNRVSRWLTDGFESGREELPPNEYRLLRKDSTTVHVHVRARVEYVDGSPVRLFGTCLDITERVNARQDLEKREAKFRAVLDAAPFPVAIVTPDDKTVMFWSRSATVQFGHTPSSVEEWYKCAYPDPKYRREVTEQWKEALKPGRDTGKPINTGEYEVTCKDGTVRTCELYASFVQDSLIVTFQDITKRRRSEVAQRESEARFRSAFEHAGSGVAIVGIDGRFQNVNSAVADILGHSREEMLRKTFEDITHPDDQEESREMFRRALSRGLDGYSIEKRYIHRDGHTIWGALSIGLLHNEEGSRIGAIGHLTDITNRKRAENALMESEELYRTLTENIGIGVAMISPELRILTLNRKMREWFPTVDVTSRPVCHRAFHDPPDEVPCSYCPTLKTLEDGETHEATTATPTPHGTRHYRIVSTPVRGPDGTVQAAIEMVEDITESVLAEADRRRLEEQFRQAQKMESVGRLAGGIAHDFNNLMTVILGYSSRLLAQVKSGDPMRSALHEIEMAGKRAAELTGQLLAFSRKQIIRPRVLDLNERVRLAEKMLRRLLGEDVDLTLHLDEGLENVKLDPGQLDQVLLNLAVNSRDAMPGGGRLSVETAKVVLDKKFAETHADTEAGPAVVLSISDTGVGMDRETQEKIFEPFFTTKSMEKGTGLGLSTVYGIIRQGQGAIEVRSEPGRGTTFRIYFPVSARASEEAESLDPAAPPGGGETILLIEDEAGVRDVVASFLEAGGYEVLQAALPGEALEIARERGDSIDMALTDVIMPDMSGEDCCQRLKEIVPGLRILYMSGYSADAIAQRGVLERGTSFIQKPFTEKALLRTVRRTLES